MKSILAAVSRADIVTDPFPHVVVHDVLPDDLYQQLSAEFPAGELITAGKEIVNNTRYDYPAHSALEDDRISTAWKEFTSYHVSNQFYQEVVELFGDSIKAVYPGLEERLGKSLKDFSTGVRSIDDDTDVIQDSVFSLNSPTTVVSSVRRGHVDNPMELYAGLYYFRLPEDDSTGGHLLIQRAKKPNFNFVGKAEVEDRNLEEFATVKYWPNTLVFFLNSIHALHAVSERSVTPYERRFVTILGRLHFSLFKLKRSFAYRAKGYVRRRLPGAR